MEDYYVDGCLYCGRCHTKKEFVGTILNMTIRVPTLCRCQAEQEEQIKRERLAYEEARRIQSQKATCIHDRSLPDAYKSEKRKEESDGIFYFSSRNTADTCNRARCRPCDLGRYQPYGRVAQVVS